VSAPLPPPGENRRQGATGPPDEAPDEVSA
jgi:hypothetical protein